MKQLIQAQIDALRNSHPDNSVAGYHADQLQAMVDSQYDVNIELHLDEDESWQVQVNLIDNGQPIGAHHYWTNAVPILWGYCKNAGMCVPLLEELKTAHRERIIRLRKEAGV